MSLRAGTGDLMLLHGVNPFSRMKTIPREQSKIPFLLSICPVLFLRQYKVSLSKSMSENTHDHVRNELRLHVHIRFRNYVFPVLELFYIFLGHTEKHTGKVI